MLAFLALIIDQEVGVGTPYLYLSLTEIDIALKRNFSKPEQKKVKTFYCPGGFNYEKMSVPSKMMMKMFIKTLNAKKDKTEEDREMIKMISSSYDISDKKYIEPILQYLKK